MLMEGRVWSERQREGLYYVSFLLSGRKPGQRENLIGCDSVVKQTSSNIASELQKWRPGVSSMWSYVYVGGVDVGTVVFSFLLF